MNGINGGSIMSEETNEWMKDIQAAMEAVRSDLTTALQGASSGSAQAMQDMRKLLDELRSDLAAIKETAPKDQAAELAKLTTQLAALEAKLSATPPAPKTEERPPPPNGGKPSTSENEGARSGRFGRKNLAFR